MAESSKSKEQPQMAPRFWCADCFSLAAEDCDGHRVNTPRLALSSELEKLLPAEVSKEALLPQLSQLIASVSGDQALAALKLLSAAGQTLSCDFTVRGEDGDTSQARVEVATELGKGAKDEPDLMARILRILGVLLLAKGQLQENKRPTEDAEIQSQSFENAIDTLDLSTTTFFHHKEEKALRDLLEKVSRRGVRKVTRMYCAADPGWCLQLLHRAATPHLQVLQLEGARAEHIYALLHMPGLRRLCLHGDLKALQQHQPVIPHFSTHQLTQLTHLQLRDLPRDTTFALLQANSVTLETLVLWVGSYVHRIARNEDDHINRWPYSYRDLGMALQQFGFRALKRLLLHRAPGYYHPLRETCCDISNCRYTSGLNVFCSICNPDKGHDFYFQ